MHLPPIDLSTLHVCSIMTSTAYAVMFALLWVRRERSAHLLHAAAASLVYAIALLIFVLDGDSVVASVIAGTLIGANTALLIAVSHAFERRRVLDRWTIGIPLLCFAAYVVPLLLPAAWLPLAPRATARIAHSMALATATLIAGVLLLRQHGGTAPRSRRVLAWALLGYWPGYVVSVALDFGVTGVRVDALVLLPMLSDQVLLGMLTLGIVGMSGERDATRLRELALRDALTGAWNRAALPTIAARRRDAGAVVLIDVDHFKLVNDRDGHAAGDDVLRRLTAQVTALLPEGASLVRLGGDEFAAICPDMAGAHRLAEAILPLGRADTPAWSVSIGVAPREAGEADLSLAIARADTLLYRAKNGGRNRLAA